jgi:hypothetical protein
MKIKLWYSFYVRDVVAKLISKIARESPLSTEILDGEEDLLFACHDMFQAVL